tara:strand:+ start:744 stop:1025 length:282 start_codon:yes stop_codon:yes gene_type:complete
MTRYTYENNILRQLSVEEEAAFDALLDNPYTTEMTFVRQRRSRLLQETDYLSLSDNTLTTAMQTYRQSLRDITEGVSNYNQAKSIVWPTKPGA